MAQAQSVALPKRLPLITEPGNRDRTFDKDAKIVNAFVETQNPPEGKEYWVRKRPGLDEQSRPSGGAALGLGVFNWKGDIFSIFGTTLYKNGVSAGTVSGAGNAIYRFDSNMGATPHLQLSNGVALYNYDTAGGLVQVTDPDLPAVFTRQPVYLDGTTYLMTPTSHIVGSEINDASDWDPLNDILAQIEPDAGVGLAKQLVYVVAFKVNSTEVFYDAANAVGSPLGTVQGAKISYGCVNQDTIQDISGSLLWVCTSEDGGTQIGMLESLKFEIISTKPIERILEGADWTLAFSWSISIGGHRFYGVTSKTSNFTLVYDLDERLWSQWTDTNGNYFPIVSATSTALRLPLLQHETNGRLYLASADYTSDDGSTIPFEIITPNFDAGVQSRGKYLKRMYFVADQIPACSITVSKNDADYDPAKWSTPRTVDLSKRLPYLEDCGSFNRRAHRIRSTSDTQTRLKAVELQMDLCTLSAFGG